MPLLRMTIAAVSVHIAVSGSSTSEDAAKGRPRDIEASYVSPDGMKRVTLNTHCSMVGGCATRAKAEIIRGELTGYVAPCRAPQGVSAKGTYGLWDEDSRFLSVSSADGPTHVLDVDRHCGFETRISAPDGRTHLEVRDSCLSGRCETVVDVIRPFTHRHGRRAACEMGDTDMFAALAMEDGAIDVSWSQDQTTLFHANLETGEEGDLDLAEACGLSAVDVDQHAPRVMACGVGSSGFLCRDMNL
ncbi:MAG: hypothetical protein AAFQ67_02150 [Pseudomonadota bacterium]